MKSAVSAPLYPRKTKRQQFLNNCRNLLNNFNFTGAFASRIASYHDGHQRVSTMDDLPVPEGDWTEAHQKKQAKYNITLAASVVFFLGTLSYVRTLPYVIRTFVH